MSQENSLGSNGSFGAAILVLLLPADAALVLELTSVIPAAEPMWSDGSLKRRGSLSVSTSPVKYP